LDKGDAFLYWAGRALQRIHCPFISDTDLALIVNRWREWAEQSDEFRAGEGLFDVIVVSDTVVEMPSAAAARPATNAAAEASLSSSGNPKIDNGLQPGNDEVVHSAGETPGSAGATADPLDGIQADPVLRRAAALIVAEGRCSGSWLFSRLKGEGVSKHQVYEVVLPALDAAGVIRLKGAGRSPEVLLDSLPFPLSRETEDA
jgi:hypothetical protein